MELGRLDGLVRIIPDPNLFISMYVRREAVFSSQIEGTQSTLEDLLEVELDPGGKGGAGDVSEIVNYVSALRLGLNRLATLPLSLRLIREIHKELLKDTFVPPPPAEMNSALGDLEKFLHADGDRPILIDIGLAHAQFETIHPFLDGNGRVGRLLITFLLVHHGALGDPLLYLSHYFKLHRSEYYDRLTAIRSRGDWEGWLRFFLDGVAATAREATATAERIFELRERHRALVLERGLGQNGLALLSALLQRPMVDVKSVAKELDVTFPTANRLAASFEDLGLLRETTGRRRSRRFQYEPYLSLFTDDQAPDPLPRRR